MDSGILLAVALVILVIIWWKRPSKYNLPPSPFCTLPIIGDVLQLMRIKKRAPEAFYDLSKTNKYSRLFTIQVGAHRTVVLNDLEVIREALITKSTDFAGRPDIYTLKLLTEGGKDIAFSPYSPSWSFHRKVVHTAIRNFASGKKLEKVVSTSMEKVHDRLSQSLDEPFNIRPLLMLHVFNVLSGIIFSLQLDFDDPRFQKLITLTNDITQLMGLGLPADLIPWLRFLPTRKEKQLLKLNAQFVDFLNEQLEECRKNFNPDNLQNVTDHMISVQKTAEEQDDTMKNVLTDVHLRMAIFDFFGAGIDTVTTTLHYFVAFMAQNPDIQSKMQQEIDSVLEGSAVTPEDRRKLPYTEACVNETMRCGTLLGLGMPLSTMCDTKVGGYDVPKDTMVLVNMWAVHNNPEHWPEPSEFRPSRFLTSDGHLASRPACFMPFSIGKRTCLGDVLSRAWLMLVVPSLWQRYSVRPPVEGSDLKLELEDSGLINLPKPYDVRVVLRDAGGKKSD